MPTTLISDQQVRDYFSMSQCIDSVEEAYAAAGKGSFDVTERKVVAVEGAARLLSLTAASADFGKLVANVYSGAPSGQDKRNTSVNKRQKFYMLFDAATGACEAIISGAHLAWMKTGAMGAVAIKHIAPHAVKSLAIIGSGRQARTALIGALAVRNFEEVRVWSPTPGRAAEMLAGMENLPKSSVAESARDAVSGADVVITATTATTPVINSEWLVDGFHINAIGAHYPNSRELDGVTIGRSTVIVDAQVAARVEKGELLLAEQEGLFSFDDIRGELGDLVAGLSGWTRADNENTVFASCGSSIESMGAAVGALRAIPESERNTFEF